MEQLSKLGTTGFILRCRNLWEAVATGEMSIFREYISLQLKPHWSRLVSRQRRVNFGHLRNVRLGTLAAGRGRESLRHWETPAYTTKLKYVSSMESHL